MIRPNMQSIAKLSVLTAAVVTAAFALPAAARQDVLRTQTCASAQLAPVVKGDLWLGFGQVSALNAVNPPLKVRGDVIETASGASVEAPAGGYVEFAGAIDNMGQVVILNIGDGNRVVLSGMATLSVRAHEVVAAHDRIGQMLKSPSQTPHLYVELRCGETPVNPGRVLTVAMR